MKMSEEKLYAVKNDEGEWLSFDSSHESVWDTNNPTFFKDRIYAEAQTIGRKAHVVELVEKPTPVVVSADEEEMQETAKNPTFRPSSVITSYSNDHHGWDLTSDLEDRLIRAYVNGLTVEV